MCIIHPHPAHERYVALRMKSLEKVRSIISVMCASRS